MDHISFSDIASGAVGKNPVVSEVEEAIKTAAAQEPDVALIVVSGHQPPSLAQANNNSFCHAIQSSPAHAHLCEPYCGKAFYQTLENQGASSYRCHAGFLCHAVRVAPRNGRQLAVIIGRALTVSADYHQLEQRTLSGDLRDLSSANLFDRVHFTTVEKLEQSATRIAEKLDSALPAHKVKAQTPATDAQDFFAAQRRRFDDETAKQAVTQVAPDSSRTNDFMSNSMSKHSSDRGSEAASDSASVAQLLLPIGMTLKEACNLVVSALAASHNVKTAALFLRFDGSFVRVATTNEQSDLPLLLDLDDKDLQQLLAAAQVESLAVVRRANPDSASTSDATISIATDAASSVERYGELFPLVVGNEVRGVLLVLDELNSDKREAHAVFCREIAVPLEVLRLREEVEKRNRVASQLNAFTDSINFADPSDAYLAVLQHAVRLVQSERGSLFLYDESSNELTGKAATGPRAELARKSRVRLGDGVSGAVLRDARPLVVRDVRTSVGYMPAPAERSYKTSSFISLPIIIGRRRVGVLNVTDKTGGGAYDELDLDLLQMLTPQIALALDRAEWHEKASQFRQLSITDSLTNLLNRRYLEERLMEEVERSKRHNYQMCFMMIDIDDFKLYNDRNGHQAGDLALELTAQNLKSALRGEDIAARYGGEEFSVLLPQTSIAEAQVIAERIRRRVERTRYPHSEYQPLGAVTVSIGISAFTPTTETQKAIISHADQALYIAKHLGKNRINIATSAMEA